MANNLLAQFLSLIPKPPLLIGVVITVTPEGCLVRLPSGEQLKVRGSAAQDQSVFFRDGVIEGDAPNLPVIAIEI